MAPNTTHGRLRIGLQLGYSGGFAETVAELTDYEKRGSTSCSCPRRNHPVRERIPIIIAEIGPKNVAMAAEIA